MADVPRGIGGSVRVARDDRSVVGWRHGGEPRMSHRYLRLAISKPGLLVTRVVPEEKLAPALVLGRGAPIADLPDPLVSKIQAEIRVVEGRLRLVHRGRNPTRVLSNDVGEPRALVKPGESLRLGAHFTLALGSFEIEGEFDPLGDTITEYGTDPAWGDADGGGAAEPSIVHRSNVMADAITRARAIARLDWSVLILGETGSGKDLFAQLIRAASPRRDRAYLCANVATIASDGNLAELELFGRVPGYPHEGDAEHAGLFEQAHRGTLFLDEIGDLPQRVQPMLLRVLEDRKVTRLGGDRTRAEHLRFCDRPLDVRLIFATHADLAAKVAAGSFREDLYYRIYENVVWVPPLRERTEDVEYLLDHFLATECPKSRSAPLTVSPLALDVLRRHSWPGNVRELRNVVRALYETLDVDAESGDEVATALVTDLDDSIVLGTNDAGARFRPHYEAWKRHDRDYKAANRALGFSDDSASIYRAIEKVIGHSVRAINKLEPSHLRARGRRPSPNHRWRE